MYTLPVEQYTQDSRARLVYQFICESEQQRLERRGRVETGGYRAAFLHVQSFTTPIGAHTHILVYAHTHTYTCIRAHTRI